tara:strand:+ start:1331 stop:1738 length:408 start_codon:yes stop_codon:yes gene_type:complete
MHRIKSTGILIFDPKTNQTKHYRDWWLILKCDEEIAKYYRYWVQRETGIVLQRSLWGSHVSIIRGEQPVSNVEKWNKHHKQQLEFTYYPELIHSNETHWWIEVAIDPLSQYRKLFGLKERPLFSFHLTIGRTQND